ncbi:hypothetical protein [Legionella santicrucis]|nr:hypothetical protein [Legionella santicrucis]
MPYGHKAFFAPHDSLINRFDSAYYHTMQKVDNIIKQHPNVTIDKNIAARIVYAGTSEMNENELNEAKDKLMLHGLIKVFNDLNKELKAKFKEIGDDYITDNIEADPDVAAKTQIIQRAVSQWATRGYQLNTGEEDMVIKITMSNLVKYQNHIGPNPHTLLLRYIQEAQKIKTTGPQSAEEIAAASANRKRKLEQLIQDLANAPDDYVKIASEIEKEARLLITDFKTALNSGTAYEWISNDIETAHASVKQAYERVCQYDFLDALTLEKENLKTILEFVEETIAEHTNNNSLSMDTP